MSHTVQHAPKHFQGFPGGGKTYMQHERDMECGNLHPPRGELTAQARTHGRQSERDANANSRTTK
jgi:hypothetical protein